MRVAVLGAGALGSLCGGLLQRAGVPVWLISRRREHLQAVAAEGLVIETPAGPWRAHPGTADAPARVGSVDLVLVTVKAGDTPAAAAAMAPLLGPDTWVLTLQNGLGHAALLAAAAAPGRVLVGVTAQGATLVGPGRVRHGGSGPTEIAPYRRGDAGASAAAARVARLLQSAGLPAMMAEDAGALVWAKLVVSSAINPLTALLEVPNGRLLHLPAARALMAAAARETAAVAAAAGVRLPEGDPAERVEAVAEATAANRSSMLQDIDQGRPTEVDAINGAVVREAALSGLEAPVNQSLCWMIKAKEQDRLGRRGPVP